jgi:hypothetical protein
LFIQIQGIEDLYVFDEGSVTVDTNGSIGMTTPARVSLNSLHDKTHLGRTPRLLNCSKKPNRETKSPVASIF